MCVYVEGVYVYMNAGENVHWFIFLFCLFYLAGTTWWQPSPEPHWLSETYFPSLNIIEKKYYDSQSLCSL